MALTPLLFLSLGAMFFMSLFLFPEPLVAQTYQPLQPLTQEQEQEGVIIDGGDFTGYVEVMINLLIGVAAVLAVIYIAIGGIQYITSDAIGGKEEGKDKIRSSLLGLVLALASWLILFTISPNLVMFNLQPGTVDVAPPHDLEDADWSLDVVFISKSSTRKDTQIVYEGDSCVGSPDSCQIQPDLDQQGAIDRCHTWANAASNLIRNDTPTSDTVYHRVVENCVPKTYTLYRYVHLRYNEHNVFPRSGTFSTRDECVRYLRDQGSFSILRNDNTRICQPIF